MAKQLTVFNDVEKLLTLQVNLTEGYCALSLLTGKQYEKLFDELKVMQTEFESLKEDLKIDINTQEHFYLDYR